MKLQLRYFHLFQKKQKWSLFLLFSLYFTTMFVFTIIMGRFNYSNRHWKYSEKTSLKQVDYVTRSRAASEDPLLVGDLKKMPGVAGVIESTPINQELTLTKDVIKKFGGAKREIIAQDNLKYFVTDATPSIEQLQFSNDPKMIDIVVNRDSSLQVGDTLPAEVSGKLVTLHVLAKRSYYNFGLDFRRGGTRIDWSALISEDPKVYVIAQANLEKTESEKIVQFGMFVRYKSDVQPAQREAVRDFLISRGCLSVFSDEEISEWTKEDVGNQLAEALPFPLGIAISAYFLCICTAVMRIFKLEQHVAIYQLAGGSQRKMFWGLNSWFVLVASFSAALVWGIIQIFNKVRPDFLYRTNRIVFDFDIYKYLLLFVALSITSSYAITAVLLGKTSLIEKLRRRQ